MNNPLYYVAGILVMGFAIQLTRWFPFVLFGGKDKVVPKVVLYLAELLPAGLLTALVIYCLRGVRFLAYPYGIPEALAIASVLLLHRWRRNTLLSIFGGTAIYMVLVQLVFVP